MITLSTASLYPYSLGRILKIASDSGFTAVELMLRSKSDNAYLDSWDANYIRQIASQNNISINSLHIHFAFEKKPDNFDEVYELAKTLKVRYIIMHTPRAEQDEYISWFNDKIDSSIDQKKNTPVLLFENINIKEGLPDPIIKYSDLGTIKNLCFDLAHAERSGVAVAEMVTALKNNIKQFHVSFWDGHEDHMGLIGQEKYFAHVLADAPKDADFCLELCPKAFKDMKIDNLIKELVNNRKALEKVLKLG